MSFIDKLQRLVTSSEDMNSMVYPSNSDHLTIKIVFSKPHSSVYFRSRSVNCKQKKPLSETGISPPSAMQTAVSLSNMHSAKWWTKQCFKRPAIIPGACLVSGLLYYQQQKVNWELSFQFVP